MSSDRSSAAHGLPEARTLLPPRLALVSWLGGVSAVEASGRTSLPFESDGAECETPLASIPALIGLCRCSAVGMRTLLPRQSDSTSGARWRSDPTSTCLEKNRKVRPLGASAAVEYNVGRPLGRSRNRVVHSSDLTSGTVIFRGRTGLFGLCFLRRSCSRSAGLVFGEAAISPGDHWAGLYFREPSPVGRGRTALSACDRERTAIGDRRIRRIEDQPLLVGFDMGRGIGRERQR